MLQCLFWPRKWIPCPSFAIVWCISCYFYSDLGQTLQISIERCFLLLRARTFKALEVNFLSAYFFQECQDTCSSAINEVKIDLLSKKSNFLTKSARACALLLRSVQNQKMQIIYIILSSHAKNQPPRTMLSYVYTLFKFPRE